MYALRCWRAGAEVTISYRRAELGRQAAKQHLISEVGMWVREGRIRFLPETVPVEITPEDVVLAPTRDGRRCAGELTRQPADFVLFSTGFVAGTAAGGTQTQYKHFIETVHVERIAAAIAG
ncbi:MAG: hypothetical protein ABIP48_30205 [Planctomycetota bacterium]